MTWQDEHQHPFAGITEKLKRADQSIVNLNSEIDAFIQSGDYPVIHHQNTKEWQEAVNYHRDKFIPLRFAVLVGEIIHHLRSCLDHVVWHFSDSTARAKPGGIEFPVFKDEPLKKDEIDLYTRKIKGITNANVLRLIEDMQPYKAGPDAANHALLIIHDMDRFDKHRELLIVDSGVNLTLPPDRFDLMRKADLYTQGKLPEAEHLEIAHALQDYQTSPSVSFREFGSYRPYHVIKGLSILWGSVVDAIDAFANEV